MGLSLFELALIRSATSGPQGRPAARAYARKPRGADATRPAFEGATKNLNLGITSLPIA